jgi:cell surface protein SprA
MRQDTNHISLSTGFPVLKNLTTQLSFDWQLSQKYTSSPTQTLTVNFPNVRVQLNEFNTLLGIEEVLKSSSLSSSYAVNNKKTGVVDWENPNTDETSINLSPLFSWSGNWVNDISSHVNLNHRQTENITFQETGNIVNESTSQSATGDISWSFSAEKGIKIPFTDERWYIKNETTLRLDASYERSWSIRKSQDNPDLLQDEQNNLNIRPQISYEFSKNITAGLTSEYRINNNVKNSNKNTTFSLSMWVEIVF